MKALILAGGRGKRMGEVYQDRNKCMIEVEGKPLIEYSLNCASQTNVSEIIIVVGHKAEEITNAYGNKYNGKMIRYVIQPEQKGLVHAIECAREAIGKEDFMLMLGDELMVKPKHSEMIKKYHDENLFALCGVVNVEDKNLIKKTYAVIQGGDNRIFRLIEKPSNPMNNVMGTGNCLFKNEIFSYIPQTPINQKRGEKELPDLIQCAIDAGKIVRPFVVCDKYFNINLKEDIKDAKSFFAHF
jgi:dTDP-glucose pyrophosphorylase